MILRRREYSHRTGGFRASVHWSGGQVGATELSYWATELSWGDLFPALLNLIAETSQELRMMSSVTLDCQETKIVMNSGSQL